MSEHSMKLYNFANAIARLEEALALPDDNKFKIDVCVKRFEFTYETCKKALEYALSERDIFVNNPREVIKQSERQGLITGIAIWDKMRDDRNDSSHEYNAKKTAQIAGNIPEYAKEFKFVLDKISREHA